MTDGGGRPASRAVLQTERLLLRRFVPADAVVLRELWTERDPRVPPHRRIDADGRPTVADLEEWIRGQESVPVGLLAVERRSPGDLIGYCGLTATGHGSDREPELAFELLQRVWRRGYATEAASAVLEWARDCGYPAVRASVWDWNIPSLRVLARLGFTVTGRTEVQPAAATTLRLTRRL